MDKLQTYLLERRKQTNSTYTIQTYLKDENKLTVHTQYKRN